MLYLSETEATTKKEEHKLVTTQKVIDRSMMRISSYGHILNEVIWEQNEGYDCRVPKSELDTLFDLQTEDEYMQLSTGIQKTGNVHSDLYDDRKMKLSSNLGQYGEGWDKKWNRNTPWPVMWKKSDRLVNKRKTVKSEWMNKKNKHVNIDKYILLIYLQCFL